MGTRGMADTWTISHFENNGTTVTATLWRHEGYGQILRSITGDHRPMRALYEAWRAAGEPEVEVLDTDDGPAIHLLTDDEAA